MTKRCTDVASHLLTIELQLDVRITCDGLQQKFQHAEYFTCNPLIFHPIFTQFSPLSSEFHALSIDSSYILCDDYF